MGIGSRTEPDFDGWYRHQFLIGGRLLRLECRPVNPKLTARKPTVHVTFGQISGSWSHPDALAMATGVLIRFDPLQPLLDWCMDNVELSGTWWYADDTKGRWAYDTELSGDWGTNKVRKMLTEAIAAVAAGVE